ncbi:hypothetical protein PABG_01588 [Paracoccidioides brasiliensis Pb03]|nr:hypothetical protein PABG_01588 [Paracoccidioides brasiliensis Pb03]
MAYKGAYNPDALPASPFIGMLSQSSIVVNVPLLISQVAQMLGAMSARPDPNQGRVPVPPPKNGQLPQHHRVSPSQSQISPQSPAAQHNFSRPGPGGPPSTAPGQVPGPYQRGAPNPNTTGRLYSPPPQNYGSGPRPTHPTQNWPPATYRPPRTPQPSEPESNDPNDLSRLFQAANASGSGALSEGELGPALVNADYTAFDSNTVKMMIQMFDKDGSGTVGYDEFVALWRFLAAWRELFMRFDEDRSGRISLAEFSKALVAFGYTLSPPFVGMIFSIFESRGRSRVAPVTCPKDGMSFDLFVQACITLKRMTDVFKRYDDDRDGYVTLGFEEFLTG